MEMFWETLVNTDWHDYRGNGPDEDRLLRLLKPGWNLLLREWWDIDEKEQPSPEVIVQLQELRAVLQRIIGTIMDGDQPDEQQLVELNAYLRPALSHLLLTRNEEGFQLQRVNARSHWSWLLGKITASFATLLAEHDIRRIKQCSNPDCRWIYYDESNSKSRRWCDDDCANIMRVRRFRVRHQHASS